MAEDKEKKRKQSRLYTTEIINSMLDDIAKGYDVDMAPFFDQKIDLRAPNITFKYTPEEAAEYMKCYNSAEYFIEKYAKFLTDTGRHTVKLRDYQKDMIKMVTDQHYDDDLGDMVPDNRNLIFMASRQTGKTTTTAAYMTWYICFHTDRNVGIMANKQDTAIEIVDKVQQMIMGLPYFLKPGVIAWGKLGATFDNGCRIISSATTKSASIGFTMNGILYLDEFAHIEPNIMGSFWRSVYPTLSSSKTAQCIVSSTPNGTDNLFYDLWDKSVNGINSFKHFRVDYWQVPGHDDKWAEQQKIDFGEEFFAQEFLLQFSSSSSSLLKGSDLQFIDRISKEYKYIGFDRAKYLDDENIKWHPDFNPRSIGKDDKFVFLIDLADGNGDEAMLAKENKKSPDSNTILIMKVVPNSPCNMKKYDYDSCDIKDAFRFIQVGTYDCNNKDEIYCANVTAALAYDLFNSEEHDNVRIMVEMNFQGKSYLTALQNHPKYYPESVLSTYHTKPIPGENTKKKPGFKTNQTKEVYCKRGAEMIHKRRIIPTDKAVYNQLKSFGWTKGKIKGIAMHDDLSFPICNHIPRMMDEETFIEWIDTFLYEMEDKDKRFKINELIHAFEMDNPDENVKSIYSFYDDVNPFEYYTPENTPYNPYIGGGGL